MSWKIRKCIKLGYQSIKGDGNFLCSIIIPLCSLAVSMSDSLIIPILLLIFPQSHAKVVWDQENDRHTSYILSCETRESSGTNHSEDALRQIHRKKDSFFCWSSSWEGSPSLTLYSSNIVIISSLMIIKVHFLSCVQSYMREVIACSRRPSLLPEKKECFCLLSR